MAFWILAAAMTALVTALVLRPLLRPARTGQAERAAYDIEVYRDQLKEVENDLARGVIDARQAEIARTEIGRRMLALAERSKGVPAKAAPDASRAATGTRWVALALVAAIPLGALGFYLKAGRPDLPARPFASREFQRETVPQEVATALASLRRHLEANPRDGEGWVLLAQVYDRMGRFQDSADAYRQAVGLSQGEPSITASFGEALYKAAQGQVTQEAQRAFQAALDADANDPRARYYLALQRAQVGDFQGALDRWAEMVRRTPADAPWLPTVRQRIAEMARELGRDPASVTPEPLAPTHPPVAAAPNPSPDQMNQAAQLTPEQRRDMVRGMVENLAKRLESEPGDVQGWLRLARSYQVLGEGEKAGEALAKARAAAPEDPDVLSAHVDAQVSALPEDAPLPPEAVADLRKLLAARPDDAQALYYLGLDAARRADPRAARDLWGRLLLQLDPGSPAHAEVKNRLDQLTGG